MNLQKFIDILDNKDSYTISRFFRKHGRDIFTNTDLLLALVNQKWSKKKWDRLGLVSWIVGANWSDRNKKDSPYSKILPIYGYLQEYMYDCCSGFGDKGVPWKEWKDLAKEQVDILTVLVKENKLKKFWKDKRHQAFGNRFDQRVEDLFNKGYYQLRDGEYR